MEIVADGAEVAGANWSALHMSSVFVPENRIKNMSKAEVVKLFESYGFVDQVGHSLLMCVDFLHLLELVKG